MALYNVNESANFTIKKSLPRRISLTPIFEQTNTVGLLSALAKNT